MDSEFSEFSYGFAATSELADAIGPLQAAPVLPSLLAEAEGGWDLKLESKTGIVLFVQFKIPFACTRKNALEWEVYGGTYYRLYIRRPSHSKQHNRLKRLSEREHLVYYLAPRFHELTTFNNAYVAEAVLAESVAFPIRMLPRLNNDLQHYICYRSGADARWYSEEGELVKSEEAITLIHSLGEIMLRSPELLSHERLVAIREDLLATIRESETETAAVGQDVGIRGLRDVTRDIVHLSRTYFNAEPIFLTRVD